MMMSGWLGTFVDEGHHGWIDEWMDNGDDHDDGGSSCDDYDHGWMGPLSVTGSLSRSFLKYFYDIPVKHYSMELTS
jgi:hypothetical protein